jgi:phage gpG-like protein
MKIVVTKVQDLITPSIARNLRALQNPTPALKALGTVLVSMTTRAFNDPGLRPSAWAPLSPKTLKRRKATGRGSAPLKLTGTLARSPRITGLTGRTVTIGSDRPYAAHHQLGSRDGKRPPARPFFPFTKDGRPTPRARSSALAVLKRVLAIRK